jgi:hypothetical protein
MGHYSVGHLVLHVGVRVERLGSVLRRRMRENKEKREGAFARQGFFSLRLRPTLFLHRMRRSLFDLHRSNRVTYQILTHYKGVPYDITYIM